ncbi:heterokaryon incompatibility protein-domain-containing protein [Podospora aff. communis PSN243]|uniref:Heterokaryon incompatibility protein-domain-containing protein n=1 Tax=Podospora aff. communis PSN243 TaxID=3040156 RepID=A0AAV9G179_9PEZI|nr:heterokaryon incompatibility protein-domain-containing protein [Podospora aff. communis PSN243]
MESTCTAPKQAFCYTPLDEEGQQTRLFTLLPGKRQSPLCGILVAANLKNDLQYDALSYVWGDPTPLFELVVNGDMLEIAENLCKALLAIRLETEPLTLWIDAICINQEDIDERGRQVQLMRSIYGSANAVRVWLDIDIDLGSPALEAAQTQPLVLTRHDLAFWDPFYQIFSNAYWGRLWTQQEFFLSRRLVFQFPTGTLDGEPVIAFERAANNIWFGSLDSGQASVDYSTNTFGHGLFSTLDDGFESTRGDGFSYADNNGAFLLNLWLRSHGLKSTDPRDHVYGLVGLAKDCREHMIDSDYNLTTLEAYAQVIEHSIRTTSSLAFLCYQHTLSGGDVPHCCSPANGESTLPTWLPSPSKHSTLLLPDSYINNASSGVTICTNPPTISHGGRIFSVRGIKHDVLAVTSPRGLADEPICSLPEILRQFNRTSTSTPSTSSTNKPIWAEDGPLCLALSNWLDSHLSTRLFGNPNPTLTELSSRVRSLVNLLESAGRLDLSFEDLTLTAPPPSGHSSIPGLSETHRQTAQAIWFCTVGGVLVATRQGTSTGLCYLVCQGCTPEPGDEVWVLFGCSMPMILRFRGSVGDIKRYAVVGPAKMIGLMDGEACKGLRLDGEPGEEHQGNEPVEIELI